MRPQEPPVAVAVWAEVVAVWAEVVAAVEEAVAARPLGAEPEWAAARVAA
jgi:hypothetical protein